MKKYKFNAIVLPTAVTVTFTNKKLGERISLIFNSAHKNFEKARDLVVDYHAKGMMEHKVTEDILAEFKELHDVKKVFTKWSNGLLTIDGNTVLFKGNPVNADVSDFLVGLFNNSTPDSDILNAWSNFLQIVTDPNTSAKVANRLFKFLNKNDLYITNDGHVLAYKVVREDYKDIYTGTMDNSVGQVLSVPRSKVDDDDSRTCSYGLHVCSYHYLRDYGRGGQPVMLVKVNPLDIVSIPTDYNGEKVRTTKYTVLAEIGKLGEDLDPHTPPQLDDFVIKHGIYSAT